MSIGITLEQFWSYDMNEIRLCFSGYDKRKEMERKETISYCYQIASMTSIFVNMGLAGKQPPSLEKIYPDLYGNGHEDKAQFTEEERFKAEMFAYTDLFNMQFQQKKGEG